MVFNDKVATKNVKIAEYSQGISLLLSGNGLENTVVVNNTFMTWISLFNLKYSKIDILH
jgi:hypothetical protein